MASALIGALRVSLGLDTAQFEAGAKSAETRAEALGYKIGTSLRKAGSEARAFGEAFIGLGLAAGAVAFGTAAGKALDYASSLAEIAQQLGVTAKDLQEYRYAASQVGISQDEMDQGLRKLTLSMGQARDGVEKPKKAFAELSALLGRDVLTSAQTAGDAIPLIADALAKVTDPAQRAALEVELFGKTGQKLDTLLSGGSAAVNGLRDAAESLGIVLSDDQIQNADRTADKLTELKMVLEANIAGVVADNAKSIYDLADSLTKAASASLKFAHDYPIALGALGGAVAGARFGPFGLIAGAAGGAYLGNQVRANSEDSNMDLRFRAQKLRQAGHDYATAPSDYWRGEMKAALDKERGFSAQAVAAATAAQQKKAVPATGGAGAGTSNADAALASRKAAADARRSAADAARKAKERARNEDRLWDDHLRLQQDQFGYEQQLTSSLTERAGYDLRRLDAEKEAYAEQLRRRVEEGELTQQQAHRLQLGYNFNDGLQRDIVQQKLEEDQRRETLDLRKGEIDLERDALQQQLDGARTQAERRRIQLDLLDLAYEQKRLDAAAVLASSQATEAQKRLAQETLDRLDASKSVDRAGVERQTQGPLAQYLDSLPKSAGELNEAYQKVAADGLQSLNDGLADAIVNSKSLGDVFHNVANQILADLIRIALQKAITGAIGSALGGIFGGGGGDLGALFAKGNGVTAANAVALPGLAAGGSFGIGTGAGGVDRNVLAINGIPRARVNYGERVTITPANDRGGGGDTHIHQSLTFAGAVDLATRSEVYRVADAARVAAIQGVHEAARRRG